MKFPKIKTVKLLNLLGTYYFWLYHTIQLSNSKISLPSFARLSKRKSITIESKMSRGAVWSYFVTNREFVKQYNQKNKINGVNHEPPKPKINCHLKWVLTRLVNLLCRQKSTRSATWSELIFDLWSRLNLGIHNADLTRFCSHWGLISDDSWSFIFTLDLWSLISLTIALAAHTVSLHGAHAATNEASRHLYAIVTLFEIVYFRLNFYCYFTRLKKLAWFLRSLLHP